MTAPQRTPRWLAALQSDLNGKLWQPPRPISPPKPSPAPAVDAQMLPPPPRTDKPVVIVLDDESASVVVTSASEDGSVQIDVSARSARVTVPMEITAPLLPSPSPASMPGTPLSVGISPPEPASVPMKAAPSPAIAKRVTLEVFPTPPSTPRKRRIDPVLRTNDTEGLDGNYWQVASSARSPVPASSPVATSGSPVKSKSVSHSSHSHISISDSHPDKSDEESAVSLIYNSTDIDSALRSAKVARVAPEESQQMESTKTNTTIESSERTAPNGTTYTVLTTTSTTVTTIAKLLGREAKRLESSGLDGAKWFTKNEKKRDNVAPERLVTTFVGWRPRPVTTRKPRELTEEEKRLLAVEREKQKQRRAEQKADLRMQQEKDAAKWWKYVHTGRLMYTMPDAQVVPPVGTAVLSPSGKIGGLYLGMKEAACNAEWLTTLLPLAVVNCSNLKEYGKNNFAYLNGEVAEAIPVVSIDKEDADVPYVPTTEYRDAVNFIDQKLREGRNVFVHCKRGRSRSVTVILGYLVEFASMTLKEAYELVDKLNDGISPNGGFTQQLRDLERDLRDLDSSTLPVLSSR